MNKKYSLRMRSRHHHFRSDAFVLNKLRIITNENKSAYKTFLHTTSDVKQITQLRNCAQNLSPFVSLRLKQKQHTTFVYVNGKLIVRRRRAVAHTEACEINMTLMQ